MSDAKIPRDASPPHHVPFSVPRTDVTTSTTVLSTLAGAHSVGEGVLGFFTMTEANVLRLVCSEMREAVTEAGWNDEATRIEGSLAAWRACFPKARAATVNERLDLTDADFVHLKGIHKLDMRACSQMGITDGAFVHLKGIHTLFMIGPHSGITGLTLPAGIKVLH